MAHAMRPLTGKRPVSRHVLIWVSEAVSVGMEKFKRRRMRAAGVRFYPMEETSAGLRFYEPTAGGEPADLETLLSLPIFQKGRTTLWLVRGWADFVFSGLAELIDQGRYVPRWMTLDGAKVIVQGLLNGRAVDVTSLACFTGGQWDDWRDALAEDKSGILQSVALPVRDGDERLALETLAVILSASAMLNTGPQRLSMGSQARGCWRTWLGPTFVEMGIRPTRGTTVAEDKGAKQVAPLPFRPPPARKAERHVCYGLPREQYGKGFYNGKVYALDMQHAYLTGLLTSLIPVCYTGQLESPSVDKLKERLDRETGLALVQLDTPHCAFPYRVGTVPVRATGRFWTWLCGAELHGAVGAGFVKEVRTAHLWACVCYNPIQIGIVLDMKKAMLAKGYTGHVAFWRGLYSSLIGSWAQWRREWVDEARPSPAGRWATWVLLDNRTGELVRYRSVAGRVQRRVDRGDAPYAVPLMYGVVTAAVRNMLDGAISELPRQTCLAVAADCLWLTEEGYHVMDRVLKKAKRQGASYHLRETYNRVWMDGEGKAVVEIDGKLYPVLTGVPTNSEIGPDGRSRWVVAEPWTKYKPGKRTNGVLYTTAAFDAGRILRENRHPFVWESPWQQIETPVFPESLLLPLKQGKEGPLT